ncbi:hypothetical protein LRAMOSA10407 [Lichtheimia ramosa]|uniref:G-protein coupled receptors family 3 profile domain-containing protein n=1 Tax=Lichtheimia ramosa TaxID=688394 RepID=A0A077WQU0_9FUNG|nr:hypothetical protein LRAMOSA10407 [Lichtheimia ramosa]
MSQSTIAYPTDTNSTVIFGIQLGPDPYNNIRQVDNGTVVVTPKMNTTGLTELKVGVLLPFSQTDDPFTAEIVWGGASAIRMAVNDINAKGVIPGAYITLIQKDSFPVTSVNQDAVTDAVYASVTLLQQGVIGVIGDISSSWTSLSALMTSTLEIPQCSFTATAASFSDKTQYKYFFRTISTQTIFGDAMMGFATTQGWSKIGIVYTDDPTGQQFCQHAIMHSSSMNIQVTHYQAISQDASTNDIANTLTKVSSDGVRIILLAASGDIQIKTMLQAAEMGYLSDDYVWMLIGDVTQDLATAIDTRNSQISHPTAPTPTNTTSPYNATTPIDFNSTFTGVFMFDNWLSMTGYPPFEAFLDSWSSLNASAYPYAGQRSIKTNEGLAYSCMMVMAEGFSHAIANMTNHTSGLEQLRQGDLGQYMLPQTFNVGYVGPEGPMVFDSNGDVAKANYLIYNVQGGHSVVVGQSMEGHIQITNKLMYHDGTSNPPPDSPPSLSLNPAFSSAPGLIITTISSLGILSAMMVFFLVVLFRKNEVFKASSPLFCCLELIGFMFTYASVITMVGIPSYASCYTTPLLFNLGFLLILGNMIAKNYRIYRIFNNIFITRTVITDAQLIKTTSIVVAADMIIMGVGLAVSRPVPTRIDASFSRHYWQCHASNQNIELVFRVLSTVYAAIMLLFATFLAYKTRAAGRRYSHYSETKQMGLSVYNILFSALVGFAVMINPMADFYTTYYITIITILWATTFSLLALFLPKIHAFFKQMRKKQQDSKNKNSRNENGMLSILRYGPGQSSGHDHPASSFGSEGGELISLSRMVNMPTSKPNKENYIEVHEGDMPVRRVFRYFPFLSHWEMQHMMVFPCLGYFSFFSEKTKEGAVMSYRDVSVHSAQLDEYVLKIHGQGLYDLYIQLPDLNALTTWESVFNGEFHKDRQQPSSSSFLDLGKEDQGNKTGLLVPTETSPTLNDNHAHHQRSLLAHEESEGSSITVATHLY